MFTVRHLVPRIASRCRAASTGIARLGCSYYSGSSAILVPASRCFSSQAPDVTSCSPPETLEFKAETLKLLRLVTHSLYTDKEVFIRELVSNASDALEKLRFLQASGAATTILDPDAPLEIKLEVDPKAHAVSVFDSGVGMTRDEAIQNLGTIAKSGSAEFLARAGSADAEQRKAIIGQFGVGFYSSFVVATKVQVFTRSYKPEEPGWLWESDGLGSFTIQKCDGLPRGTKIVCHLSEDAKDFGTVDKITDLAKKFSSFVSFPISITKDVAPSDGKEGTTEKVTIDQDALWLRSPTEITSEQHSDFFRHISGQSWSSPMYNICYHTDAPLAIKALLYIPEEAPNRLFMPPDAASGVAFHSRRILVSKNTQNVIPKWLSFLKGVVDCDDVPLNISRESLQDSRIMEKLSITLVRRVLKFLKTESESNPEKYKQFYNKYSQFLKEGVLENVKGQQLFKDALVELLRFESSERPARTMIALDEYLAKAHPSQKNIYYYCSQDRMTALASPYLEQFSSRGIEVLLFVDEIDEFVAMHLGNFKGKRLVSIDSGDEEGITEDLQLVEPRASEQSSALAKELCPEHQKELEEYIQGILGKQVSALKFSSRLVAHPAVVSGFLPATLRRMMQTTMKHSDGLDDEDGLGQASRFPVVLELNPRHTLVHSVYHLKSTAPDIAKLIVEQLLDNAKMTARLLEEPHTMVDRLNQLLQLTASYAYHGTEKAEGPKIEDDGSVQKDSSNSLADDVNEQNTVSQQQ